MRAAAVRAGQLPVDEHGDTGFLGAGAELVVGDQARHRRVDEFGFLGGEKLVGAGLGDIRLVRFSGLPGHLT